MVKTTPHQKLSERINHWLLHAPIQTEVANQSGGVVGWLDRDFEAGFVYGEITGYYLSYLASIYGDKDINGNICRRIKAASLWVHNQLKEKHIPLTRCYFNQPASDWYNQVCFSFDLAMMLRGISQVRFLKPPVNISKIDLIEDSEKLTTKLLEFIDSEELLSTILPAENGISGVKIPFKWSTTSGPFQAKTAAAILSSQSGVEANLKKAAKNIIDKYRFYYIDHPVNGDLHSLFYCLEGLLIVGNIMDTTSLWENTARIYTDVMAYYGSDGNFSFGISTEQVCFRSDVIAQALRIGIILKEIGLLHQTHWKEKLDRLYRCLARYVGQDGGVRFVPDDGISQTHWNVWCAMFAFQACDLYEQAICGKSFSNTIIRQWIANLI